MYYVFVFYTEFIFSKQKIYITEVCIHTLQQTFPLDVKVLSYKCS